MEKFLNLPKEKQDSIVDAALISFGNNGYKKTSVNDVATAAGVSKASLFHYFGTKKALYLYLINLCGDLLMNEINKKFDTKTTDFFDRIMQATDIEISVMKQHPAILLFLNSIYFENDDEVKDYIKNILSDSRGEDFRKKIAFDGIDTSKFKDGVDPKLVYKMLLSIGYGYSYRFSGKNKLDLDALYSEFEEYIKLLKNNLYKN